VAIENIDFEQRARLALRGQIAIDASRRLSGRLEVGISETMLLASENSRLLAICSAEDDGFRWISLDISGSSKAPGDNFMKLYEATPAARDSTPGRGGIPSFDELIAPE